VKINAELTLAITSTPMRSASPASMCLRERWAVEGEASHVGDTGCQPPSRLRGSRGGGTGKKRPRTGRAFGVFPKPTLERN
jgi:hypothetical protein